MKKIIYLIFSVFTLALTDVYGQLPPYYNIAVGTSTNAFPWSTGTGKGIQWLVDVNEFSLPAPAPGGQNITTIWFYAASAINATYTSFSVQLGQISNINDPAWTPSAIYAGSMTTVILPATKVINVPIGWFSMTLDVPFLYNPSQALVVYVSQCGFTGTSSQSASTFSSTGVRRKYLNPTSCVQAWSGQDALMSPIGVTLVSAGPCIDPPTAGTATANPTVACTGAPVTLNTTGGTFGIGQTWQWKSSPTLAGAYTTNVGGVLSGTALLSINPVATLYYKCFVTCGANTDSTTAVLVTVNPSFPGGVYTINNTLPTGGGNFQTFTAAVNAMACGISGPVIFNVSAGQTFTEDVPVINVNSNVTNTLKFLKGGIGTNPVIRPTGGAGTTDAGIAIVGTDYLTFDGIDINIATGTAVEFGYYITNNGATNGATNDSIKNCTISLSRTVTTTRGIFQNVVTVPTSAAGANSNNTYANLTIKNVYVGILMTGNITFPDVNNMITTSGCGIYNIIGDPATPFDIGGGNIATQTAGIRITNQAGFTISNNKVSNVSSTTTTDGIFIETFFGAAGNLISTLSNNIVRGIRINSTTASTQVNGIRITNSTSTPPAGTVLRVYNNAVSEITSAYATATGVAWAATTGIKGMNMASTTALTQYSYEIYNNSVSIDGSGSPFLHSTAFQRSVTTAGNTLNLIRNNNWANFTGAQVTPAGHYAFVSALVGSATALGIAGSAVNNNNLYISNTTQGFAARGATTDYPTVALWQTANIQATVNQAIDPQFLNNLSDLHVNNTALDALGAAYPVYLTIDLDCATRTGVADIGAYLIIPCTGAPTAGTVSATPSSVCPGGSSNLTSVGFSTGVTFQWVSSTVSGGPYTAIGAATSFNYNTGPLLVNTYYKLVVTCVSSALKDSSAQIAVNITAAPTVSISPVGPLSACAGNVVPLTSTNNAATPAYQWKRNGVDIAGATLSTFTPVQTGSYTLSVIDNAAPASCPGLSNAVIDTVFPLPPTAATATPATLCSGDSSQLNANVFVGGILSSPVTGTTNGSAATGFDITNISTGPITLHYFSYQSSSTLGTIANQSVYVRLTPMNCVFPTNVTTDPSYILVGTVPTTSNGPVPAAPTVIPLDVNITIPAGATYAFAVGGASQQYWNGTTGCPIMGSTAHLQVREGWGGTFTGIIANRQWHGSVTYDYGDPNATVVWSPATGLSSTTAVNPKASPPVGTTTYTVTVTGTGGCTKTSSVSVTNLGIPDPAPTTVGDTNCAGIMSHLTATGVSTLNWYSAATGGILKHTGSVWDSVWNATTTYWVESFNGNCPSPRTAITVLVYSIPTLNPTATPSTICFGDSSSLNANNFISATVPMLPEGSLFPGSVRGYSFTAPTNFTITGLQDLGSGAGLQSIAIVKFIPPVPPPIFSLTTTAFTILFITQSDANLGVIPVNIPVSAGDVIGLLSQRGTNTSYATPTGPFLTSIAGFPVTFTRMGMQSPLTTTVPGSGTPAATGLWTETAGAIGRCQITYAVGDPNVSFNWQPPGSLNNASIVNPTAGPTTTTTYSVTATNLGGCTNTATVMVNVNPVPPTPTIDSTANIFCGCGSATLYAHINGSGTIIRWYGSPTGGSVLGTGSPFNTPVFCGPKTFYAEEFDLINGCKSLVRSSVLITPTAAATVNAGTDIILCDGAGPVALTVSSANPAYTYTWSPAAGLSTTTGATVSANPVSNTTYIATGIDTVSGCVNMDTVTVFVGLTPVISSILASPPNICSGDSTQLSVTTITPGTMVFTWSPSTGLSGVNQQNPRVAPPVGSNTYTVTLSNNGCTSTATVSIFVSVTPPAPTCSGDTICGQGIVNLTAAGTGDTLIWTDTTGGPVLGTGGAFNPYVTKSGSYYVREVPSGSAPQFIGYGGQGNTSNAGGGGQLFFPSTANAIFFKVTTLNGIMLKSVDIIPSAPIGTEYEIELLDSLNNSYGSFKGLTTVTNPNIPHPFADPAPTFNVQTVPVNIYVPAGSWWLRPTKNPNLAVHVFPVNPAGTAPPYTITGKLSINGYAANTIPGTIPSAAIFGLFYNWQVLDACIGPACQANYIVTPPPPLTITPSGSTSFCGSGTVNLTAGGDPGWVNFTWVPATGLNVTTGNTVTASPLVTTTYTVTANDGNPNGCIDTQTVTINVNGTPFVSIAPPPADSLCVGTVFTINASAGSGSFKQIGFTENPGLVTGQVFNGGNLTQRSQGLFMKSELNAAGLFGPTAITSIAFDVSSKLSNQPYSGFTVKIAIAPTGCMTSTTYQDTGFTTCFTGNYSTTLGWNLITFTTPYIWNGTSDIIVETCFTNGTTSFFDQVFVSATTGCNTTRSTNAAACAPGAGTLAAARPNVRFTGGAVSFSWSPGTDLSSTTVEDPVFTAAGTGPKTYTVTVNDPATGCTASATTSFVVTTKPKTPSVLFIGDSVICQSGGPKMRAFGTTGSYQWQVSTNGISFNNIPGANDDTLNAAVITISTWYRVFAFCGDTTYSRILFVLVNNPLVVSSIGDTVCGFGQVCLSATKNNPSYSIAWYNVPTGGTALAAGDTFCTNISSNSTFYAQALTSGGAPVTNGYFNYTTTTGANIFPLNNTAGASKEVQWFVDPGSFVQPSPAPNGGMITTISFYAGTTGNATYTNFTLKLGQTSTGYAGGAIYTGPLTTVILPSTKVITSTIATWFTLTLDVPFAYDPTQWLVIDMGQCGWTGTGISLYQNALGFPPYRRVYSNGASGCSPVWVGNDGSVPGITLGLTTGSQCFSPRVPVVAVSTPPPAMALVHHVDTVCEGSCISETVNGAGQSNYQFFTWAPATGLSATTGVSVNACPLVTTTYTVTALDTVGLCQKTDTVRVVISPAPTINISSTPPLICLGDSAQLESGAGGGSPTSQLLTTPLTVGNSSSAIGFDITNTSAGPVTIHFLTFTSTATLGTALSETIYYSTTPLNCTAPANVTIAPGWINLGTVNTTSAGTAPALTPLPLDLNITIPAGLTYAFAFGGASVAYSGTGTTCVLTPIASDANISLKMGFGGTLTGTINFRSFNGSVSYTTGSTINLTNSWTPVTGLSNAAIHNPKASPAASTTYTVTVTNSLTGCTKTASVTVNVTPQPIPYVFPNDSVLCTGQIINIVARDSGVYGSGWPSGTTFDFGFGPTTDSTFLVNGPGNYNVHVALPPSLGSCNKTSFFANIDYRDAPVLIVSTDSVDCNGTSTGSISSQVFLGSPPYRFKYYNSLGNVVRDITTNLTYDTMYNVPAGNYCVIVYDTANVVYPPPSCASDSVCIQVGEPPLLVASEVHTIIACNGNSSTVTITATGGTPPLTGTGVFTQFAGTQVYIVTDALGCTDTVTVIITQPPVLTVSTTVVNIICGYVAANINSTVAGGTPSYEYLWSNNAVTPNLSAVGAGTYTVTVTDANGCTATSVATVSPPGPLTLTSTPVMPVCRGAATGSITIGLTGGVAAYTFLWNGGNTNQNRTGLAAGTYTVTVTDANGCTKTKSTVITQPATTLVINSSQTNVRCFGLATGVATASPAGGSTPYSYSWNTIPVKTTASITGLTAGVYTCNVTDAIGCTKTLVITITQPTDITVFQTQSNVTFPGGNNGSATVSVSGGTPGYTYSWNTVPVQTTASITGLFAGTYKCTITDTKSCTKKVTFIITEPIAKTDGNSDANNEWRVKAYPNPTSGTIMISFVADDAERINVTLTDYTGRLMYETTENTEKGENLFTYDLAHLSKGIYFMRLDAADRNKVIRIVIE